MQLQLCLSASSSYATAVTEIVLLLRSVIGKWQINNLLDDPGRLADNSPHVSASLGDCDLLIVLIATESDFCYRISAEVAFALRRGKRVICIHSDSLASIRSIAGAEMVRAIPSAIEAMLRALISHEHDVGPVTSLLNAPVLDMEIRDVATRICKLMPPESHKHLLLQALVLARRWRSEFLQPAVTVSQLSSDDQRDKCDHLREIALKICEFGEVTNIGTGPTLLASAFSSGDQSRIIDLFSIRDRLREELFLELDGGTLTEKLLEKAQSFSDEFILLTSGRFLEISNIETPLTTVERVEEILHARKRQIHRATAPIIRQLQQDIDSLAGHRFTGLEDNRRLLSELHNIFDLLGVRCQCSSCAEPATLRCARSNSATEGVFHYSHVKDGKSINHRGSVLFPSTMLVSRESGSENNYALRKTA